MVRDLCGVISENIILNGHTQAWQELVVVRDNAFILARDVNKVGVHVVVEADEAYGSEFFDLILGLMQLIEILKLLRFVVS